MRLRLALPLALVSWAALPSSAAATVDLTAYEVRVADHRGFVRVVVDFTDGKLGSNDSEAADPDPFPDGRATVDVRHRRVQAQAPAVDRHGVRVRVTQATNRIRVLLDADDGRFKYLRRWQLPSPERLVLDLYKARSTVRLTAADACIVLGRRVAGPGRVDARGTARNLFESSFALHVRDARGRIRGTSAVTYPTSGRWSRRVRHTVRTGQDGMLEAVALSARDGTLDCLAQARVRLRR